MAASPKNDAKDSINNGPVINSIEFSRKALEIRDTIAASRFQRLSDILVSSENMLDYHLIGSSSREGEPLLQLYVRGCLQLRCQRCLEPLDTKLDIASDFFIVSDESAIPSSEEEGDDKDYLVADAQLQVLSLIEDELLLALPLAPMHETEHCSAGNRLNELKPANPFAILEALKTDKDRIN